MMLAATLHAPREIAIVPREQRAPGPADVVVEVAYVGLCGSDLSYFSTGANGDFVVRAPFVLGHEVVGTVRAVGSGVEPGLAHALPVGARVAVHPAWPSPRAGATRVAEADAGDAASFLGSASTWPHTDGGLQERIVVRAEQVRRLPDPLPLRSAVLAEPTAVVLHALARSRAVVAGADVLVCGAGPIGLLAAVAARRAGARSVTVTDVRSGPLALASEVGADETIDVSTTSAPADRFSYVVEASGVPASLVAAVDAACVGATVVQLGMLPRDERPLRLSGLVTKELTLVGTHRFAGELDDAIAFLATAPECARIVQTVVPLAETARAFAALADPSVSGKVLVEVAGG